MILLNADTLLPIFGRYFLKHELVITNYLADEEMGMSVLVAKMGLDTSVDIEGSISNVILLNH